MWVTRSPCSPLQYEEREAFVQRALWVAEREPRHGVLFVGSTLSPVLEQVPL